MEAGTAGALVPHRATAVPSVQGPFRQLLNKPVAHGPHAPEELRARWVPALPEPSVGTLIEQADGEEVVEAGAGVHGRV